MAPRSIGAAAVGIPVSVMMSYVISWSGAEVSGENLSAHAAVGSVSLTVESTFNGMPRLPPIHRCGATIPRGSGVPRRVREGLLLRRAGSNGARMDHPDTTCTKIRWSVQSDRQREAAAVTVRRLNGRRKGAAGGELALEEDAYPIVFLSTVRASRSCSLQRQRCSGSCREPSVMILFSLIHLHAPAMPVR